MFSTHPSCEQSELRNLGDDVWSEEGLYKSDIEEQIHKTAKEKGRNNWELQDFQESVYEGWNKLSPSSISVLSWKSYPCTLLVAG